MFQTVSLSIITVHTAIRTGFADCLLASSHQNLYYIYVLLCVRC